MRQAAGMAAGHMRNRNFVINFGIATAVVSVDGGSEVVLPALCEL